MEQIARAWFIFKMAETGITSSVVDVTSSSSNNSVEKDSWEDKVISHNVPRTDLNSVVMEYLVREGFREAAQKFQQETGINPGLEPSVMESQIKIRHAIESGDVQTAVESVNDLDPDILDNNAQLFFHLQLQQLLEYIRHGDLEGALTYAQGELAARGDENPKFLGELEEALALLAYDEPSKCPFSGLLQHSQRLRVVSEINSAILGTQGKEGGSQLSMLMKLVLWAQQQLEKKNVVFPKLNSVSDGTLTSSSTQQQEQPMQQQ